MTNKLSIVAILAIIGAGTLQVAISLATIPDLGVRVAFIISIIAAIIMDGLVIHEMGSEPSNGKQQTLAIVMFASLFIGLALDIVLLLSNMAFQNNDFGWLRAFVGINIAVSLVCAAAYFAASNTNTHARQIKSSKESKYLDETNAFLESKEGSMIMRLRVVGEQLKEASSDLGIPLHRLTGMLDNPHIAAIIGAQEVEVKQVATLARPSPRAS